MSILRKLGIQPDPVQQAILTENPHRCLINCTRQWGKSTVTAALAAHKALSQANSLTLVLSPSSRQSGEFLLKAKSLLSTFDIKTRSDGVNELSLLLPNNSRIIGLPGVKKTTRGFSGVSLLIVDEAAQVSDDLYHTIRPSLASSNGSICILSTPFLSEGFFYDACMSTVDSWRKFIVPATDCPRISKEFLEEERRTMSERMFRQEYLCEFLDSGGSVFPGKYLDRALKEIHPLPFDKKFWAVFDIPEIDPSVCDADFLVAVDLGQVNDYTAICIIEVATIISGQRSGWDFSFPTEKRCTVRHLERMPLGTPYGDIIRHVCTMLRHPILGKYKRLLIDATGVGRPIVDLFREAEPAARVHGITITGGNTATRKHNDFYVPRQDLFSSLQISFQTERLGISQDLPESRTLLNELRNLKHSVTQSGEATIEQSTTKVHDDLAFATAMANWKAFAKL